MWWEPCAADQATFLLCIPKKDSTPHTALDTCQQNDNTVKDVTPLPDQEVICKDIAWACIRSKIDLTNIYEQVRIHPSGIPKTVFMTITETYFSNLRLQCSGNLSVLDDVNLLGHHWLVDACISR